MDKQTKLFEWINTKEGFCSRPSCMIECIDRKGRSHQYIICIHRIDDVDYTYCRKSILFTQEELRHVSIKHYMDSSYIGGRSKMCTIEYLKDLIKDDWAEKFFNDNQKVLNNDFDIDDARLLFKIILRFHLEDKHQRPLIFPDGPLTFTGPFID